MYAMSKLPHKKDIRITLRYQSSQDTPDSLVLDYIKHHPVYSAKEAILLALRQRFVPFAYLEQYQQGAVSREELERVGKETVQALYELAQHICWQLDLTQADKAVSLFNGKGLGQPLGTEPRIASTQPVPTPCQKPEPYDLLAEEWGDYDEEFET